MDKVDNTKLDINIEIDKLNEKAWNDRNSYTTDAISFSEQAHSLALEHTYNSGLAQSLLIKSYQGLRQSDFKNSLHKAHEALQIFEKHTEDEYSELWLQRCLNTLGIIYGQIGNFNKAQQFALRSYKLAQKLNLKEAEANALLNLAIIYVHFGEYDSALEHNFKSLKIHQSLGNRQSEIKILLNIGVILFELGRYSDALEQLFKAEKLSKDKSNQQTYALICSNLGRTYHRLGDNQKSKQYQDESKAILEELNDRSNLSYLYDEIGKRHLDNKNYEEAKIYLQQSIDLKRSVGDQKGEVDSYLHLGNLYLIQNNLKDAQNSFDYALDLANKVEAKKEQVDAYLGLAQTFEAKRSFEQAYENLKNYTELKDALFSSNSDQRFQALRVKNETEQKEKENEIYRLKNVELVSLNNELRNLTNKLEKQAIEDPLTKLYNRRHFEFVLQSTYKQSIRYQKTMSVLICDIDNFKKVNDTFSHAVGDKVLIEVANIFKSNIRDVDTVARYGGEEFVIVFPETTAQKAAKICDRLRHMIETFHWHTIHPDLKVTISMGICEDTSVGSGEAMIANADVALYKVKQGGKNHIRIWQEEQSIVWSPEGLEVSQS